MSYLNEQLFKSLKKARKAKGLSQRELSAKSGVPQSHISKIESGGVDLRVSSLINIARNLDLELELVPRKTVPAVQSIIRQTRYSDLANTQRQAKETIDSYKKTINSISHIGRAGSFRNDLKNFEKNINHIERLKSKMNNFQLKEFDSLRATIEDGFNNGRIDEIQKAFTQIGMIRNNLLHSKVEENSHAQPAYRLDDEGDDE